MKKIVQIQTSDEFCSSLQDSTGQQAASKAFMFAAASYDSNIKLISELSEQVDDLKADNLRLYELLSKIESTYRQIQEELGQADIFSEVMS